MMKINELAAELLKQDDIAVISHVSPDGDAVGSAVGLCLALRSLGKRACAVLQDAVPQKYVFLSGAEDVCTPDNLPFAPKCAVAVDVADPVRMGTALTVFEKAPCKFMVDHHETNRGFGDFRYVDGTRASCGEILLELTQAMGVQTDRALAECLFVAVDTDTGNFNYKCTDERALMAAAECVRCGAEVEKLTRKAFRERSFAAMKLLGEALHRAETRLDGKIVYSYVDDAALEMTGARLEDASRIVNYFNEVTGALVGVYVEQHGVQAKISWRSACDLNVAEIARHFGGGGHDRAAGATLNMSMKEAIDAVLDYTEACVKGYEAGC